MFGASLHAHSLPTFAGVQGLLPPAASIRKCTLCARSFVALLFRSSNFVSFCQLRSQQPPPFAYASSVQLWHTFLGSVLTMRHLAIQRGLCPLLLRYVIVRFLLSCAIHYSLYDFVIVGIVSDLVVRSVPPQ